MNRQLTLRYIEKKPLKSLTGEALSNIKLLTFNDGGVPLATVYGSSILRIQKYASDIDLLQDFIGCYTKEEVIKKYIGSLQKMVKKIEKAKLHYFSEFKCGYDSRFDIEIGKLSNGIYYVNEDLLSIIKPLYEAKYFTGNEYRIIKRASKEKEASQNEYDIIYDMIRDKKILRWSLQDILKGEKDNYGMTFTLGEALKMKGHVKIDMIVFMNGAFVEMTNFIFLAVKENNRLKYINLDKKKSRNDSIKLLKEDIEKLFYSHLHFSPFKGMKRIFALSRVLFLIGKMRYGKIIDLISPFITSDVSLLYQQKSQIDSMIKLLSLDSYSNKFNKNLDNIKYTISSAIILSKEKLYMIINLIDQVKESNMMNVKKMKLEELRNLFNYSINSFTIYFMKVNKINPLPNILLPPHHHYKIMKY